MDEFDLASLKQVLASLNQAQFTGLKYTYRFHESNGAAHRLASDQRIYVYG